MSVAKILIVEDSELLHRMYGLILAPMVEKDVEVVHAYNGQEGLSLLASNPDVSLIILDINMPVMSGLEFLLHRRREKVFEDIPVVIISTEGKEDDTMRGLQAGARGYLKKPFHVNDLMSLIARVNPELGAIWRGRLSQKRPGAGSSSAKEA